MIRTRVVAVLAATITLLSTTMALASTTAASSTAADPAAVSCPASPAPVTAEQADRVWRIAGERLAALAGPVTYPFGATGASPYVRTSARSWTSGFYPTSLWLMYGHTQDSAWLTRARAYTTRLLPVARWGGTHDLGFMVGEPTLQGLRLDPSTRRGLRYATAMRTAARTLSDRWNPHVQAMRSAYYDGRWGLIIDSAMNAPLLLEAALVYGGPEARALTRRGTQHLLTLAEQFVRPDGSTYHRLAFDPRTGKRTGVLYGQGLSAESTWARGQAWAIAGFARGHLLTGDARLLAAAQRTADYWISQVPAGCVPAWDLDVTDPGAPRDSSAAAIASSGLLLLSLAGTDPARAVAYREYALRMLGTLASPPWVPDRGRGILAGQAYNVPADRREGTYVWGDAYLLQALTLAAG